MNSLLLLLCLSLLFSHSNAMPCPFTRVLSYDPNHSMLKGNDVFILQNLIVRSDYVTMNLTADGIYGKDSEKAVRLFQQGNGKNADGVFDSQTAQLLLEKHLHDDYKDDGQIPHGYLYKVFIPVHRNRSIETMATLYDANMTALHVFRVRTHGQNDPDTGMALNQLCGSGNTPTGLMTFDLNSPEEDPVDYGPFPVNRAVKGEEGNAKIIISDIRDGILMHTGEWKDWNPTENMPNSHGCIHGHPVDIQKVWKILVGLGVEIRPNTNGKLPYPYKPQGILSIQQID